MRIPLAALALSVLAAGAALPAGAKSTVDPLAAPAPAPTGAAAAYAALAPMVDIDTLTTAKETYAAWLAGKVNPKRYAPSAESGLTPANEAQATSLVQAAGTPTAFILVERDAGTPGDTYIFRVETQTGAIAYRFAMDGMHRVTAVGFAPAQKPTPYRESGPGASN